MNASQPLSPALQIATNHLDKGQAMSVALARLVEATRATDLVTAKYAAHDLFEKVAARNKRLKALIEKLVESGRALGPTDYLKPDGKGAERDAAWALVRELRDAVSHETRCRKLVSAVKNCKSLSMAVLGGEVVAMEVLSGRNHSSKPFCTVVEGTIGSRHNTKQQAYAEAQKYTRTGWQVADHVYFE